jgi:hypothetical protein
MAPKPLTTKTTVKYGTPTIGAQPPPKITWKPPPGKKP